MNGSERKKGLLKWHEGMKGGEEGERVGRGRGEGGEEGRGWGEEGGNK